MVSRLGFRETGLGDSDTLSWCRSDEHSGLPSPRACVYLGNYLVVTSFRDQRRRWGREISGV